MDHHHEPARQPGVSAPALPDLSGASTLCQDEAAGVLLASLLPTRAVRALVPSAWPGGKTTPTCRLCEGRLERPQRESRSTPAPGAPEMIGYHESFKMTLIEAISGLEKVRIGQISEVKL
jgi:hypothetical protein